MSNPITSMLTSMLRTQLTDSEQKMEDRVAVNSIYAQRTVEQLFITPDKGINLPDTAYVGEPMLAVAHADVKATMAGTRSSYDGAVAYADTAKARRDELLAKYNSSQKEETSE